MSELCKKHQIPLTPSDCRRCHGEGVIEDDDFVYGDLKTYVPCWECKGTGIGLPDCEFCIEENRED